jgi:hypothetical protein
MAKEVEAEIDKIFTEWSFNDLAGNRHTIRPWSLTKTKTTFKLLGEIYAEAKTVDENVDFWTMFNQHIDVVFTKFIDKFLDLICITLDKNQQVLDNLDIALGLEVIEVIWKQNFTGERVKSRALNVLKTIYPELEIEKETGETPLDQ